MGSRPPRGASRRAAGRSVAESGKWPIRMPTSIPSSIKFTMRSDNCSSALTCGNFCMKRASIGATCMRPNRSGAATASVPDGAARSSCAARSASPRSAMILRARSRKRCSRLGQADRPRGPLQQPGAQVLLEACDLTRDHRRRHAQPPRGGRESAGVANGDERRNGVEPVHIIAISAIISCRQRRL